MKVNTGQIIVDLDSRKIVRNNPMFPEDYMTVGSIFTDLLGIMEQGLSGSERMDRHNLAVRIHRADAVDLDKSELRLLHRLLEASNVEPLRYGQVAPVIEAALNENSSEE